jgi:hypothetical protein
LFRLRHQAPISREADKKQFGSRQTIVPASKRKNAALSPGERAHASHLKVDVVTGWHNKLRSAISLLLPSGAAAEMHRREAAPGTAR